MIEVIYNDQKEFIDLKKAIKIKDVLPLLKLKLKEGLTISSFGQKLTLDSTIKPPTRISFLEDITFDFKAQRLKKLSKSS